MVPGEGEFGCVHYKDYDDVDDDDDCSDDDDYLWNQPQFGQNLSTLLSTAYVSVQVQLSCSLHGTVQVFLCSKWLAGEVGDGRTERRLAEQMPQRTQKLGE